jgi:hypothetical protein
VVLGADDVVLGCPVNPVIIGMGGCAVAHNFGDHFKGLANCSITLVLAPRLAPGRSPSLLQACAVFHRDHHVGAVLTEPLAVEFLDEHRQGQLPRLLVVIVELAELLRVEAQFARHLDLLVREPMALTGVDPDLERFGYSFAGHDHSRISRFYALAFNRPTGRRSGPSCAYRVVCLTWQTIKENANLLWYAAEPEL